VGIAISPHVAASESSPRIGPAPGHPSLTSLRLVPLCSRVCFARCSQQERTARSEEIVRMAGHGGHFSSDKRQTGGRSAVRSEAMRCVAAEQGAADH
jgi:hypothetical protein